MISIFHLFERPHFLLISSRHRQPSRRVGSGAIGISLPENHRRARFELKCGVNNQRVDLIGIVSGSWPWVAVETCGKNPQTPRLVAVAHGQRPE